MTSRLRIWQQKIQRHPFIAISIIVLLIVCIAFALAVRCLGWDWTGLTSYSSPIPQYQRGKTLWDWLQLLVIPLMFTIGGFWLTRIQKDRDQKAEEAQKQREEVAAEKREKLERENREDNQREKAVQEYIDKMSELLLKEHLRKSQPSEEVRKIARIRTLTVLRLLDGKRKRIVLQFLYESDLIDKDNRIVELHGADFYQADFRWIHLENAHLGGAFCREVDFSDAFLHGTYFGGVEFKDTIWNRADLSEAYLNAAIFLDAGNDKYITNSSIENQLKEAKFLKGATMPNGSIHP